MGNVYNFLQLEFGINGCEGRNKKSRVVVSVAVVQDGSVHQGFFGDPNLNRSEFG